jgi:hypothetical protein
MTTHLDCGSACGCSAFDSVAVEHTSVGQTAVCCAHQHVMAGARCLTVQCSGYSASCPALPPTATKPFSVSAQNTPLQLSRCRHCGGLLLRAVTSGYRSSRPSADMASSARESASKLSCDMRRAGVGTRTTGVQESV